MIRSMTGFGREQQITDSREITVEIRSVNHRYHEFSAKTPRQFGYLEEKLKTLVASKVSRGKVEVSVVVHNLSGKELNVTANRDVVESYFTAIQELYKELPFKLKENLSLSDIFKIPERSPL